MLQWIILLTVAVLQATMASAKLSCPDLSKFDVTCSAAEFSGIRVSKGDDAKPEHTEQGESSLIVIFASDNRCSMLLKRSYMDIRQGKEVKYTMSCFFPDQVDHDDDNVEDKLGQFEQELDLELNDNNEDKDIVMDTRLVCTNSGFHLPGDMLNVHMEINEDFDSGTGGVLYLFGTASSINEISSWTDTCKLL